MTTIGHQLQTNYGPAKRCNILLQVLMMILDCQLQFKYFILSWTRALGHSWQSLDDIDEGQHAMMASNNGKTHLISHCWRKLWPNDQDVVLHANYQERIYFQMCFLQKSPWGEEPHHLNNELVQYVSPQWWWNLIFFTTLEKAFKNYRVPTSARNIF